MSRARTPELPVLIYQDGSRPDTCAPPITGRFSFLQCRNIFILDKDIATCARYHCDQHVIKMILESVQLLCTALNKRGMVTPYKSTHIKHPCVLWVEESHDNFLWLVELTHALNAEYRFRFQKEVDHKSMAVLQQIEGRTFPGVGLTEFAQAMPAEYKVPGDAVRAYRKFYAGEKLGFARWTRRPTPDWLGAAGNQQ